MHSPSKASSGNIPESASPQDKGERVQLLRSTDRKPSGEGRCYRCFRPKRACLCSHITQLPVESKFIILMHPKEFRRQRTGTGILTSLMLKNAEYHVGVDFTKNEHIQQLLSHPDYLPVLLYPGPKAVNISKLKADHSNSDPLQLGHKKLLVFVLDGTWWCAKKMYQLNPFLHDPHMRQISFTASFKSRFIIKKQPADYCLSTIESCQVVLSELCRLGIEKMEGNELLEIFSRMVNFQIKEEAARAAAEYL